MDNKAIITVKSFNDMDKDEVIEVVTPGKFEVRENGFIARYDETEISGMAGTITTIKIEKDKFILLREGTTTTQMEFEEGETSVSMYSTPYGFMDLSIHTNKLSIEIDDKGGYITANYAMAFSGQPAINTEINIKIVAAH